MEGVVCSVQMLHIGVFNEEGMPPEALPPPQPSVSLRRSTAEESENAENQRPALWREQLAGG
jgi:hypothetical protein